MKLQGIVNLGQFGVPDTCENWLGLANSCAYYAWQPHEIYQVLSYSVDFKDPRELSKPLSETSLSKYIISICKYANIWNDRKAQK